MKRALGEAAVVAEAEVDDRMNHPLVVAAAVAVAEDNDLTNHPLVVAAAVAEAEDNDLMNHPLGSPRISQLFTLFVSLSLL